MNAASVFFASIRRIAAGMTAASLLCAAPVFAAPFTWSGGGNNNNWTTGSNWVGGVAPTPATSNDLTFSGGTRPSPNVTGTTYQLNSITFDAGATTGFTITGASNSKLVLGSITNSSSYLQTIGGGNTLPTLQFNSAGTINSGASGIKIQSLLAGSANLSKTGSGQLEIANASVNSYSGNFTVSAGSLLLGANIGSANVDVTSGAILNTAAAGAQVNNLVLSGTLLPGTSANYGSLTVNGNATFNPGSTTLLAVGAELFDSVSVTGTTSFGGTLSIDMESVPTGFDSNLTGDSWQLFAVDSANILGDFASVVMTGTFGNVTFYKDGPDRWNSEYLGNGQSFSFFTSGANAGVLYAVPEPSTLAFAGIGAAMCGWSTWTRRRAQLRRRIIERSIA